MSRILCELSRSIAALSNIEANIADLNLLSYEELSVVLFIHRLVKILVSHNITEKVRFKEVTLTLTL